MLNLVCHYFKNEIHTNFGLQYFISYLDQI